MPNNYFAFKQFTVHQERCAMKVGTDGVLLGSWAGADKAETILDIGTGTGLIALMCAQRSHAKIVAVEIDSLAAAQAEENRMLCPWKDRITIINDSIQHFAEKQNSKFDLIVSNPPYFRDSLKSPRKDRSIARHNDTLTYESLFHICVSMLKPKGTICLIFPASADSLISSIAYFNGTYPVRKLFVRPDPGKKISRCMAEFSTDPDLSCQTDELLIKKAGEYTGSFMKLTKDYYLLF